MVCVYLYRDFPATILEVSRPRVRRFPLKGFSLIEIALGVMIFSLVSGIVFTIYSRSNTYAAKGTWRVHTVAKQRTALRQMKDFLEKSSYPSAIRVDNYVEDTTSAYKMKLGSGGSVSATAAASGTTNSLQVYSFTADGDVLSFHVCIPDQDFGGVKFTGKASSVLLSLETGGATSSAMRLIATSAIADVQLSGTQLTVGVPADADKRRIVLLEDVKQVDVGVSSVAFTKEKTVMEISVKTVDPFDGRLALRETAKAVVNVIVEKPGGP